MDVRAEHRGVEPRANVGDHSAFQDPVAHLGEERAIFLVPDRKDQCIEVREVVERRQLDPIFVANRSGSARASWTIGSIPNSRSSR